ncbi:hypothetical protein [Kitasatospora sp. NPDC058046]|uniref:hypothetical protein n=1 Tax=Kitasatospora sp. NPDC058046 TaxID=3346312 RepID=UPI0036DD7B04
MLTDDQLAVIRADLELAESGRMIGVPAGAERYEAWVRIGDHHARALLDHVDVLTRQLGEARELVASYGTPVTRFPPLPPEDPGLARQRADRELMKSGFTTYPPFVGLGICPDDRCPTGPTSAFHLTTRGRLPVHRGGLYDTRCDSSGAKPAAVLACAYEPDPDGPRVHAADDQLPQTIHAPGLAGQTLCDRPATAPLTREQAEQHGLCRACREALHQAAGYVFNSRSVNRSTKHAPVGDGLTHCGFHATEPMDLPTALSLPLCGACRRATTPHPS